ncbi:MAG: fluoride efflux transporter CrcB [Chitinophagales bacterium]
MSYLAIFLGGGFGSLCRFALSHFNSNSIILPIGTMAANFLSCIVLAFVTALIATKSDLPYAFKAFFAIGFCGGFSTFSTFSLETYNLLRKGEAFWALANVGFSMLLCLLALSIGFYLHKIMM